MSRGASRSDYTLRPFESSDLGEIDNIDRECFGQEAEFLTATLLRAELTYTDVFVVVAIAPDGVIIGYVAWRQLLTACSFLLHRYGVGNSVEILSLAVLPRHRGLRLGERLLEVAEAEGAARFPGAECMHLHVRADNQAALQLYERFGYHRAARVGDYYGDGCDAWEMVRELPTLSKRQAAPEIVQQLEALGFGRKDAEMAARWAGPCEEAALDFLTGDVPVYRYVRA